MRKINNLSDALPEIIGLIVERLDSLEDCVRFGAVCRSWHSIVHDWLKCNVTLKTLPWIMFPRHSYGEAEESCDDAEESCDEHDDISDGQSFFSLSADKFYELNLPEAFDRCCSGSPYGWIILFNRPQMEIFNPITHVCLPLPPLTTIEGYDNPSGMHYFFTKVVVAISPSSSSAASANDRFIVLATFQGEGKPAFARPGDESWTLIDIPLRSYDDILLVHNQVYIIDDEGTVAQFDMISHSPVGNEYALDPDAIGVEVDEDDDYIYYLVEILGELYMVVKIQCYDNYGSAEEDDDPPFENCFWYSFKVFKLDFGTGKWNEVFTLGDYAIFVGCSTSFSLLVSEYPESRSCIYFTDHSFGERRRSGDAGIYKLETKKLVSLVLTDYIGKLYTPPFWFIPNFW